MFTLEQESAAKKLASSFFNNGDEWDKLKSQMDVLPSETFRPESEELYLAGVILGEEHIYLEKYWETAQDTGRVENLEICKDCYDFISSGDPRMMEDVFINVYGEEEGNKVSERIEESVFILENERNLHFMEEVPELVNTFSNNNCDCCGSKLGGERFFTVWRKGEL